MSRGGKRTGAGRKVGSGKYGEPTKVIRVPVSKVSAVSKILLQTFQENAGTKATDVFKAKTESKKAATLYSTKVAAGFPSPADEYSEGPLDLNEHLIHNSAATFFVKVTGDSMIGAGIHPGDLLIVDRSLSAENNKVAIVAINGELTVKRLSRQSDCLYLLAENPHCAKIEVTEEMDAKIWGIVTTVIHPL